MSPAGRPWWYSGDEDDAVASVEADAEPDSEPQSAEPQADEPPSGEGSGIEWTALLMGAQRMVDWATERVMAPHAEHDVPADHPQCVVCRTMVLIGEGRTPTAEGDGENAGDGGDPGDGGEEQGADVIDEAARARDRQIAWIPIR